jgi:peptide chain release factor 1
VVREGEGRPAPPPRDAVREGEGHPAPPPRNAVRRPCTPAPKLALMIEQLVEQIRARFAELEAMMSDPAVIADRERYAEVGREYRQLKEARALAEEYATLKDDVEGARELLAEAEDAEMRAVVDEAPARLAELEEEIRLAMVEQDPNDEKNVIVEIRAGTGGDEAALFAGDLYKMLTRYAELRGFSTDVLSQSLSEAGGFKEVTFEVRGEGAYSVFKFEGGTHRVQRVPETESQGRIHTSTATIAVLPEAEEVDVQVDQNDLQVDVYRSSGPGGQSVNTTDSAVRITHKPSGIVVSMQDEKSQLQNRDKAMRVLRARLLEKQVAEQQEKIASERKAQVGSGTRSEKVRTYNFPQGRITDHRIKHTSHNLEGVLDGEVGEFTNALAAEEKRQRLEDAAGE